MITNRIELREELEKLRQQTLPVVWEEAGFMKDSAIPVGHYMKNLDWLLTNIKKQDNYDLRRAALGIIKNHIEVEVEIEHSVEVYWH